MRISEGMPIMDLNNLDIKIDNEDQDLIILYSLPSSYDIFIDIYCMGMLVFH